MEVKNLFLWQNVTLLMDHIAKILREKRYSAGAINFDRYEVKFEIDEKGKPISVYFKYSKDANKLVEEFMLLANKTVAEKIGKVPAGNNPKVLPYRIHDLPDPDKLDNLSQFIARFGYKLRTSGTKTDISKSINHLLDDVQGKNEENLIETVSIRAMQKAKYSVHNIGHYGLAFDYYTHFTSPIRRFPDLMVHRLLTRYLEGGRTASETKYEELCVHSSDMSLYKDLFCFVELAVDLFKLSSTSEKPLSTSEETFKANKAIKTRYIKFIIFCRGDSGPIDAISIYLFIIVVDCSCQSPFLFLQCVTAK